MSTRDRRPQAHPAARRRQGQEGFTLVEALIAIVVLVFGLIAVTNLMVVAGTSNRVAGDSTVAANVAQQQMELVRSTSYATLRALADGPDQTRVQDVQGVGRVVVTWRVQSAGDALVSPDPQLLFITVSAETQNPIARARSRAEYTVFRACTDATRGCPVS